MRLLCRCLANPLYEILPRGQWLVEAGICQRSEDFAYDASSQSLCCPSVDYCCPNSVTNCDTDPRATFFQPRACPQHAPPLPPPRRQPRCCRTTCASAAACRAVPDALAPPVTSPLDAPRVDGCRNLSHLRLQRYVYRWLGP